MNTKLHQSKQVRIVTIVTATALAVMAFLNVPPTAYSANSQEQIIFSGVASGSFGIPSTSGQAYFWIWCKNTPGPNSHTYSTACNGSMSFPALGITQAVTGDNGITEPSEGRYVIHVQSRTDNGHSVDCTLINTPPVTSGPINTVNINCTSSPTAGAGSTNNAVVIASGLVRIK